MSNRNAWMRGVAANRINTRMVAQRAAFGSSGSRVHSGCALEARRFNQLSADVTRQGEGHGDAGRTRAVDQDL